MKEINNKNSLLIILFIFSSAVNFFLSNKGVSVIDTFHYDSASRILEEYPNQRLLDSSRTNN